MRLKSILIGIFFGLLIVVGLFSYKDYGIPWDESIQRKLGSNVYDYVLGRNDKMLKNSDRYYGPPLEVFLIALENVFDLTDTQEIYQMRHLVNYLLFVLGVFFFYLLLVKRFRSIWWGVLGSTMLVLSPRIFAHSFYNTKDIGFMSLFIIAAYFALSFADNKKLVYALITAFFTGLLIDVRVMGVMIPVLLLDVYFVNGHKKRDKWLLWLYFSLSIVFVVMLWPILWQNTLGNFIQAFNYYPQKTSILYFGERLSSLAVPWHYALGWIFVTTPLIYVFLSGVGLIRFIDRVPKLTREDLFMLGWFLIPLALVIVMKAVLYDAWRQLFFIYPPVLYFAVFALAKAKRRFKRLFSVLLVINFYFIALFMIKQHPYQNLYLNKFVKPPYDKKFELDYWGLSYKQGLEHIASIDNSPTIKISVENLPGENNLMLLDEEDRKRFEVVDNKAESDYYLTNYRGHKEGYDDSTFYSVKFLGTRVLGVHKLNNR